MLVAGVDTSTQSCKVVICRADDGAVVRTGSAPHPSGTACPPDAWWSAFLEASERAGGLDDVSALSVGGQQHGMVCLDADGNVIRDAILWNDTRSAEAAGQLIFEKGRDFWASAVGSVPVASYTVTKLRWLADHEPENAAKIAAICLPHDWLTWKISGSQSLEDLRTDRSDASGTGYYDSVAGVYRRDLLAQALRITPEAAEEIFLPKVLGPKEFGLSASGLGLPHVKLAPGLGDNAGAALGMGVAVGETWLSLGTSGVVGAVSDEPWHDPTGVVSGFADATGRFLPLQVTLNGAPIMDHMKRALGVNYEQFSALALSAEPGAGGLVLMPFFGGERTPNIPDATGSLHNMTPQNMTPENLARAAVESLFCLLGVCVNRAAEAGAISRVLLIGGGARSAAACAVAPSVLGRPVDVLPDGEYVALGAARQAAWALDGSAEPPRWDLGAVRRYEREHASEVLLSYERTYQELFGSVG